MSASGFRSGSGRSAAGRRSRGEDNAATGYGRVQSHRPTGSGSLRQLPTLLFCPEQASSHMTSIGSSSRARPAKSLPPAGRPSRAPEASHSHHARRRGLHIRDAQGDMNFLQGSPLKPTCRQASQYLMARTDLYSPPPRRLLQPMNLNDMPQFPPSTLAPAWHPSYNTPHCEAPIPFALRPDRCFLVQDLTFTQRLKLTAIASSICLVLSSLMVNAAEPLTPLDRKSFKTIPSDPAPSEAQRRELDRVVDLCIKTVDREAPGGHFEAYVDGGIVSSVGIDKERFKFWKCMSQNGHRLAPINK